jgi:hypothetical protein
MAAGEYADVVVAFAVVRILRTGRQNMPSARTPDASLASSTAGSSASSSAGAATPPLPTEEIVRPGDCPSAPALAFGGLRLVEVPGGWPPYDCEVHGTACPAACEVSVASPCADLDLGTSGGAEPPGPSLTFSAARPSAGTADPAVAWSRQFAQVVAEILAGARSPRQIAPWTTERVRDRIILLTQTLSAGQKPRIRRIVTSRPAALVVEMTVVLSFGPRSRALALRIEQLPGRRPAPGLPARPARWLCTEIEIG